MSLDQKKQVVPGIPLAALDAITDQNVRQVLKALVDAHQVRNGAAGTGDERFVTAREVGLVKGNTGVGGGGSNYAPPRAGQLLGPAAVGRIITDLQAQVLESPLFKLLGERIDLIDKPGGIFERLGVSETVLSQEISDRKSADTAEITAREALGARVGTTEAGLVTEQTARVNADNALTQSVTTQYSEVRGSLAVVQQSVTTVSNSVSSLSTSVNQVQASVGANSIAVQQVSSALATTTGEFNAKIAFKIDNNGYVTGFGLMSSSNNSVPFSEFIVRADRFALGSPSGPGITPSIPFIVKTVGSNVGGEYAPPGMYVQDAFIMNGSITRAKIGDLAVDTLKIAGNSVIVGTYDQAGGNFVSGFGAATLITRTLDLGDGNNSGVIVAATVSVNSPNNATVGFRVYINGVVAGDQRASIQGAFGYIFPVSGFGYSGGRFATIHLEAYSPSSAPGSGIAFNVGASTMACMGGKR